jgi:hypothetical protein
MGCFPLFSFGGDVELEPLLTPQEAADVLRITVPALRELCRRRTQTISKHPLKFLRLHKKAVRFRRSDIAAFLEDCVNEGNVQ